MLTQSNLKRKIWAHNQQLFIWEADTAAKNRYNAATISTDASDLGWGASTGITVASGEWTEAQKRTSINWRELKAVTIAIKKWRFLANIPLLVLSDNITVIAAIRSRASQAQPLQELVDELNCLENMRNCEILALHIPGVVNDLPDKLSRNIETNSATILTFNKDLLPKVILTAEQLVGMAWRGRQLGVQPFMRHQKLELKKLPTAIVVTTPDLPFFQLHLRALMQLNVDIWILVPQVPSSYLPIPQATHYGTTQEGACEMAPRLRWLILKLTTES